MDNIFRLYANSKSEISYRHSFDSIFDLIGHQEPDQTKALGFVLSKSDAAMRCFLYHCLKKTKREVDDLLQGWRIVDCELIQQKDNNKSDRADIVIRFPVNRYAIIIEAKSATASIGSLGATEQVEGYSKRFENFDNYFKVLLTLTNYTSFSANKSIINIKWSDIIDAFENVKKEEWLIKDFVNYLLKIQKIMHYYDVEVLSIPAKGTIEAVKRSDISLYECPTKGRPYKSRGEKKPLYMAFRGKGGRVESLYKIDEVISVPFIQGETNSILESMAEDVQIRIKRYISEYCPDLSGEKWVFLINQEESIKLQHPIMYERNNVYDDTRPLKDYFAKPEKWKGEEGVVVFHKKK